MMDAIPLELASEGWDQDMETIVLPLDLESFMECFWADAAPYYIPAVVYGEKNGVVNYSKWAKPTDEEKEAFGDDVIGTRRIERAVNAGFIKSMYTAPNVMQFIGLMEQDEHHIVIKVLQAQNGAPYAHEY